MGGRANKNTTRRTYEEGEKSPQRLFAQGGDHCPVKCIEKLLSIRPEKLKSVGPLYLTPLKNFEDRDTWFSVTPIGENKID